MRKDRTSQSSVWKSHDNRSCRIVYLPPYAPGIAMATAHTPGDPGVLCLNPTALNLIPLIFIANYGDYVYGRCNLFKLLIINGLLWRRGWDSNPRTPFWGVTRFRVEPGTTTSVPLLGMKPTKVPSVRQREIVRAGQSLDNITVEGGKIGGSLLLFPNRAAFIHRSRAPQFDGRRMVLRAFRFRPFSVNLSLGDHRFHFLGSGGWLLRDHSNLKIRPAEQK